MCVGLAFACSGSDRSEPASQNELSGGATNGATASGKSGGSGGAKDSGRSASTPHAAAATSSTGSRAGSEGGVGGQGGSPGTSTAPSGTKAVGGASNLSTSGGASATSDSHSPGGGENAGGTRATTGGKSAKTGSGGATSSAPATGGTATTGGATSVNLPPGIAALFPVPGSHDVCPDPMLHITFSGTPKLGSSGTIKVIGSSGAAVASIDLSAAQTTDTIGGRSFTILRPVYVDGNTVSIRLPSNGLAYGQTYSVTISGNALSGPSGAFNIADNTTWRFTTAAEAPSNLNALSVAADGSGQFCTLQGALNAIPANNTTARTITLSAGTYHEIVYFTRKNNLTIQGTDRAGTVIAASNNDNVNPSTQGRALFGVDAVTDLQIKNLTLHNQTPQGGSQAEALRLQTCDKCVVRDATIKSLQDTLLWSGRLYAENCLIEGNVDYVWGTGVAYFNQCELRTTGRTGVIVQSRNGAGAYGYVFVDSKLTADSAATNNLLARIDVGVYPNSHVAFIDCQMTNVAPAGWTITGGSAPSSLRFWEYQSTDASGNALNVSQRVAGSTRISASQAAQMRDPTVVLGGWQPS